jgi:UDP-N-acetylglucosamine 2-epimerase
MTCKSPLKVLLIFGTRPEAIKMLPVYFALQDHPDFSAEICVTAQHREMLDQVLQLFQVEPKYDLNIMGKSQTLETITSKILELTSDILTQSKPDLVLVQGDTTTAFAGALAAFYKNIPVGHIEAGLRTYNKKSPWPEEINRQMVSRIAEVHFAPTNISKQNLIQEKICPDSICITGNTVIDSLFNVVKLLQKSELKNEIQKKLQIAGFVQTEKPIILITGHRRENFGSGMQQICNAISQLAKQFSEYEFVYPVHLNPNVQKPVHKLLGGLTNVQLIQPVEYACFIELMSQSYFIISDSGGVQEEAPSLGKPVLVTRDTTERPEAVNAGTVKLVNTDTATIVSEAQKLLTKTSLYQKMATATNPYGDGQAAQKILQFISKQFLASKSTNNSH